MVAKPNVSLAQVATALGINVSNAKRAADKGRLVEVLDTGYKARRFDLEASVERYARTAKPRAGKPIMPPGGYSTSKEAARPQNESSTPNSEGDTVTTSEPQDAGLDLERKIHDTETARIKKELAQLDLDKKRGRYLDVDQAKSEVWQICHTFRDTILGRSTTLAARLVGLDEAEIRTILDEDDTAALTNCETALGKITNPSNELEKQEVEETNGRE